MKPKDYFTNFNSTSQKQYEALRAFFLDKIPVKDIAKKYGYTMRSVNSLVTDFNKTIKSVTYGDDPFFKIKTKGRKEKKETDELTNLIIQMRKKYLNIEDIKIVLDSKNYSVSEKYIYLILKKNGFDRLPRRTKIIKNNLKITKIEAEKSVPLDFEKEEFSTNTAGLLLFLPYLEKYGIIKAITQSDYPETSQINRTSSILSFLALKLSNVRRYSIDDLWCMDRGTGLFSGLNVLPKTAWFSSYSHRVTRKMNLSFLKSLHSIWTKNNLMSDTRNLDFVTIPYWGEDNHLENNWSGKRGKSLASMLSILSHDPDSGIIDYGDTDIKHENEHRVVIEFLDFYRKNNLKKDNLKYLVFDSKFTNYENLSYLNEQNIKFITIRRRGKNIVKELENIPSDKWKKLRIIRANGKGKTLKIFEKKIRLKGYDGEIRQIALTGHGKIKPALIITNDFDIKADKIIRKYSRRWLVEKEISEQTDFFHLNRVSSSMVIKVDFDLTMSILAHNLYRLFAADLNRYSHFADIRIFEKFILNSGKIEIKEDEIKVGLKKKRDLPLILSNMENYQNIKHSFLGNKKMIFDGLTYS